MQITHLVTNNLSIVNDIPIGTTVVNFSLTLGGALFIAVGQNVFTNRLLANLQNNVPNIDPSVVLSTGATSLKGAITAIDPSSVNRVLDAYNGAITQTFYVSLAMACFSSIGALLMEWKSVKKPKTETVVEKET